MKNAKRKPNGYWTRESGMNGHYNRRYCYQSLNSFSGKIEHWYENDITLIKETLS